MKIILYSSSVYSCHLFLISSASVRSIPLLSFFVPIFAWNVPLVSLIFLKRSLVFPILLFTSISLHWSLRKVFSCHFSLCYSLELCIEMDIFPFLLCLSLLFFSQLFVRPCQTIILPFLPFFFLGFGLITASCTVSWTSTIVLQAICLSGLIPWIYLSLPVFNCKEFD